MTQPIQLPEAHSRTELQDLVQRQLATLLSQGNFTGAKTLLVPVKSVDVAEAIDGLSEPLQAIAFRLLPQDKALVVYEYLQPNTQRSLLDNLKRQEVTDIFDHMSPDDRVRLFDELPARVVSQLLTQLSPEERSATALLLGYAPETAGRIMTPRYLAVSEEATVADAFETARSLADIQETIYYIYVVDADQHLKGVLSLRDLVIAQVTQTIRDIMQPNVVSVSTDTDQEAIAQMIKRYDWMALPVVDHEQRLVGIVTVDDILDILERETTEDIYTLGGLQKSSLDYFRAKPFSVARKRVVWLLILLVANTLTGTIVQQQEEVLEAVVALAFFVPLLIDTGGNIGAQSSTVVIRGLSTEEITPKDGVGVVLREVMTGALLGGLMAALTVGWAYLIERDFQVAYVVGISLFAISVLASFAGSALPLLFHLLKRDPALMSGPFITTIVDVLGVLIYFMLARLLLPIDFDSLARWVPGLGAVVH